MNRLKFAVASFFTLILVGCGGGGSGSASVGGTAVAVTVVAPLAVKATSYQNAKELNLPSQIIPPTGVNGTYISSGFAFSDFFRDGTVSMVGFSIDDRVVNSKGYRTSVGSVHFFKKDAIGNWVDRTSELLTDRTGCISPRKIIVADFNQDGRPDIFASCHGIDDAASLGEIPRILLSQPDGRYTNVPASINCYCHGASAADVNGDGYPDILVVDPSVAKMPFFLMNNKNGTFTPDYTRLPTSVEPVDGFGKPIFTVEMVDVNGDGKVDIFFGGSEPTSWANWASRFLINDGTGRFISTAPLMVPVDYAYGLPLDIVVKDGSAYILRVHVAQDATSYQGSSIQKVNLQTLSATTTYTHAGAYANVWWWIDWIMPFGTQLVGMNSAYKMTSPQ